MTKLRFWLGALLAWLLLFFNVERFHEPLNIASFVYVLAALSAILVVVLRRVSGFPFGVVVTASLASLLVLKSTLGYPILGPALPITITEACSILLTLALSRQIADGIAEFESSANDVLQMQFDSPTDLNASQSELYREVRRARTFGRPLTLFALSASNASHPQVVARYLEELQVRGVRKYINAKLADVLKEYTSDCDVVAYGDDRFIVLCPEISNEEATAVIERLCDAARERLGITLTVGSASFPDEEVTLGGLVGRAESELSPNDNPEARTTIATPIGDATEERLPTRWQA